jgi:hypothetical protein
MNIRENIKAGVIILSIGLVAGMLTPPITELVVKYWKEQIKNAR